MIIDNIISSFNSGKIKIEKKRGWRTEKEKQKAVELRLKGCDVDYIAEKFDVTGDSVLRWCNQILGKEKAMSLSRLNIYSSKRKEQRRNEIASLIKTKNVTRNNLVDIFKVTMATINTDVLAIKNIKTVNGYLTIN